MPRVGEEEGSSYPRNFLSTYKKVQCLRCFFPILGKQRKQQQFGSLSVSPFPTPREWETPHVGGAGRPEGWNVEMDLSGCQTRIPTLLRLAQLVETRQAAENGERSLGFARSCGKSHEERKRRTKGETLPSDFPENNGLWPFVGAS
jgi:hypothetical protein